MKSRTLILCFLSVLLSAAGARPGKLLAVQDPPADPSVFTVDDVLDLAGLRIADLSEDGRWLAVTSANLRDRIGVDNYRYGDPSYIAPSLSDVWVIDTQTQEARRLFPQKVQVQSLKWSRNGEYLAFLLLRDGLYRPMIWERRGGKVHPVTLPADRHAAANSEFEWAPAGDRLFLSLRPADWQEKASRRFQQETQGPIVFHSSREP
ncbi:MAG: hypothetical protein FJW35_12605, partial [Acidobacteria bacterium]|nr:hypothetical protein [Acidobacteriota bacterium]